MFHELASVVFTPLTRSDPLFGYRSIVRRRVGAFFPGYPVRLLKLTIVEGTFESMFPLGVEE
jgi:hypothetical protein